MDPGQGKPQASVVPALSHTDDSPTPGRRNGCHIINLRLDSHPATMAAVSTVRRSGGVWGSTRDGKWCSAAAPSIATHPLRPHRDPPSPRQPTHSFPPDPAGWDSSHLSRIRACIWLRARRHTFFDFMYCQRTHGGPAWREGQRRGYSCLGIKGKNRVSQAACEKSATGGRHRLSSGHKT